MLPAPIVPVCIPLVSTRALSYGPPKTTKPIMEMSCPIYPPPYKVTLIDSLPDYTHTHTHDYTDAVIVHSILITLGSFVLQG